jgi:ribosomal protein L40E
MRIVEMFRTWGNSEDTFKTVQVNAENPDSWTVQLRTTESTAAPGLDLMVQKLAGEERVWISFEEAVPAEVAHLASTTPGTAEILPRLISAVNDTRGGSVTCSIGTAGATTTVAIRAVIYQDGFSRHTLNITVLEIAKGYSAIRQHYDELVGALGLVAQQQQELKSEAQSSLQATAVVRCLSCHATNPPGSRFCNQCGAPLVCPSCDARNPPGSRFCNQCGTSLGSRQS